MLVPRIPDQRDDLSGEAAGIDRLGCEPLIFSAFDFGQVIGVEGHHHLNIVGMRRFIAAPAMVQFFSAGGSGVPSTSTRTCEEDTAFNEKKYFRFSKARSKNSNARTCRIGNRGQGRF
jgi:hypothetical protein